MRLVKLELRDAPFWFLHDISGNIFLQLSDSKKETPFFDIDEIEDFFKDVINRSASILDIYIVDINGKRLRNLQEATFVDGEYSVDLEDTEVDQSDIPEIVSITIPDPVEEDEEEISFTPKMLENAKILLERNGNTIKKSLRALPKTKENIMFLYACIEVEQSGQCREGILTTIQQYIMESSK